MDKLIKLIEEKKELYNKSKPLPGDLALSLKNWFRIQCTYASNALAGNSLTRTETILVIDKGITIGDKTVQELQEAINSSRAFDYIYELVHTKTLQDINSETLKTLNKILMACIDSSAGDWRSESVKIPGLNVKFTSSEKITAEVGEFIKWMHKINQGDVITATADAILKLFVIRPFNDGNGRLARLVANLIIMQNDYPPFYIDPSELTPLIRSIEKAITYNDSYDYYTIIYNAINRSLDLCIEAIGKEIE